MEQNNHNHNPGEPPAGSQVLGTSCGTHNYIFAFDTEVGFWILKNFTVATLKKQSPRPRKCVLKKLMMNGKFKKNAHTLISLSHPSQSIRLKPYFFGVQVIPMKMMREISAYRRTVMDPSLITSRKKAAINLNNGVQLINCIPLKYNKRLWNNF